MLKRKQSNNVIDVRKGRAKDIYNKSKETVGNQVSDMYKNVSASKVSSTQRQNANALGLGSSLADLQNQANKLEAQKRTRFTPGSDNEVMKSLTRRKK